jgi:hypothetical protein
MRSVNRDTFRVLNDLYAKDAHAAYTLKGAIADADVSAFEAIGSTEHAFNTTNGYAKDKQQVFHTTLGGKACVVKGAEAATFVARGHGYGSDSSAVYFERKRVAGADPKTWRFLRGPHSVSGKKAYFLGERISGADGDSCISLPAVDWLDCCYWWCRDNEGYYRLKEAMPSEPYLAAFGKCFIFVGNVCGVSLTWDRKNQLDPHKQESWAVAEHVWIDVVCSRWLQKPDIELANVPKLGEPFRFGQGLRLSLLAPSTWMNEERIWSIVPHEDTGWADNRLTLSCASHWWEYSSIEQIGLFEDLISLAGSCNQP